jgi:hypothetical protein
MATDQNGLSNVAQVEALADQLSACADAIHARVMKEIRRHKGEPVSQAEQARARALLNDAVVLRQRANSLYLDAAAHIVDSLNTPQENVAGLTAAAAEKIRQMALMGELGGLVAAVLALAAAASTGQGAPIVLALETIGRQLKAIERQKKPA